MNKEVKHCILNIENAIESLVEYFEHSIATTGFVRRMIEREIGKAQRYLYRLSKELEGNNESN